MRSAGRRASLTERPEGGYLHVRGRSARVSNRGSPGKQPERGASSRAGAAREWAGASTLKRDAT